MKQDDIFQREISRRRLLIKAAIEAGSAATIISSRLGGLSGTFALEGQQSTWPRRLMDPSPMSAKK